METLPMALVKALTRVDFDPNLVRHQAKVELVGIERFFPSIRFPSKGITFYHGNSHGRRWLAGAEGQSHFTHVSLLLDVNAHKQRTSLGSAPATGLAQTRFLSMVHTTTGVQDLVRQHWSKNLSEQGTVDELWPEIATKHPHLFDGLVELPEFSHLAAIAYDIAGPSGRCRVITVFDPSVIGVENAGQLAEAEFAVRLDRIS